MTTPIKQKFHIEDCSGSEQEEDQKKSIENQTLFQTTLFSSQTLNCKQQKKKPLAKLTLQHFLTNYDQNFDDVFGEEELLQMKQLNESQQKKKRRKPQSNSNKKKRHQSNSESEIKQIIKKSVQKQTIDSKQSIVKQIEIPKVKESVQKNQIQKNANLTKINSNKFSSEEKSSEIQKYNPNLIDLPDNTKVDKKNQKLKKFVFNFGLEQQNTKDQDEKQRGEAEEQKENVDDFISKSNNKKNKQKLQSNQKQLEQQNIDEIENNRQISQVKLQNQDESQKQTEEDQITFLDLDTLKMNIYIQKCNPKVNSNQNKDDNNNNINQ